MGTHEDSVASESGTLETREDLVVLASGTLGIHEGSVMPASSDTLGTREGSVLFSFFWYDGDSVLQKDSPSRVNEWLTLDNLDSDSGDLCNFVHSG